MHSRCEQVRGDGESREVLQRPEERMWLPYKPLTEETTLSGIDRVYLNTDCTWASSPEQSRRALSRRVAERGVKGHRCRPYSGDTDWTRLASGEDR